MLSLLKLHVYTLTTIGLLSDVREANTSALVSKTLHKRDRAAPNLGMMSDILCVCVRVYQYVFECRFANICFWKSNCDYKRGVFVSDPSKIFNS